MSVSAGVTWDAVYITLDPFSIGVPGGRVGAVAVAGLTSGGGV